MATGAKRTGVPERRAPVVTALSVLVTTLGCIAIVHALVTERHAGSWTPIQAVIVTIIAAGAAVNILLGIVAGHRGERRGGFVAGAGIALWILMALVLETMQHD